MHKTYRITVIAFLLIALGGIGYLMAKPQTTTLGSVQVSHEYQSTTTAPMSGVLVKAAEFNQLIRPSTYSSTILGSVVVASTTAHAMNIYNATSTDGLVNGDAILITRFPTSTTQGTYTLDIELNQGLVIQLQAGFAGGYVFTFR